MSLGYIKLYDEDRQELAWTLTEQALRFGAATVAKPLHRASADRSVQELLRRVEEVNSSDAFLYRVTRIVAFDRYITDQERISDIFLYLGKVLPEAK